MEKTYKYVPFNIELAKKIQAGEIEGRIITLEHKDPVRIICFDRNCGTNIIPYIALVNENNYEYIYKCNSNGLAIREDDEDISRWIFIELPEETPNHEFKPFDKVLVRPSDRWKATFYSHLLSINKDYSLHVTTDGQCYAKDQIIPYEGNEHLVGTTDKPKEE